MAVTRPAKHTPAICDGMEYRMSDAKLMLLVESRKKSTLIAVLLNILIPGLAYVYVGRWVLGIIAFILVVALTIITLGYAAPFLWLMLIIDALLVVRRYNKRLIAEILAAHP
jgi:TM2 domain-containing membrane protein YozV